MSKATTFFVVLLLLFSLSSAARRAPTANESVEATNKVTEEGTQVEDSCKGISEDECLMRRTLNAHTDYIYTQQHNP
ncbi:phytosulfokines 3-like [Salvia miltiorrhiza]|uniref:phytosulfokines 3-like n=1 Tax=Salvia miltiorrhiza TaxID=226208 RepID=UPI0025AC2337|nr:phytosulfokines 3-like [Salvia miltiorrhiza]